MASNGNRRSAAASHHLCFVGVGHSSQATLPRPKAISYLWVLKQSTCAAISRSPPCMCVGIYIGETARNTVGPSFPMP